ncbi:hypothetical protein ACFQV4_30675 [Streptomyces thermocarboxydus]
MASGAGRAAPADVLRHRGALDHEMVTVDVLQLRHQHGEDLHDL